MDQPIGVIDSGVGGLTVARELMRQLPKEKLIYLGDTVRCPYGSRPKEEIIQFTLEMVDFLIKKEIKLLVIACNTATAFTLDRLREKLSIPVIGVIEPGARAAIKVTKTNHVAVLGTEGTIRSGAYPTALNQVMEDLSIYSLACPKFVPLVESGDFLQEESQVVIEESLLPLKKFSDLDTVILGCTHYPIIADQIQKAVGEQIKIISSGEETAREVSAILAYQELSYEGSRKPEHDFFTTGSADRFKALANRWMDEPIDRVTQVNIEQISKNK